MGLATYPLEYLSAAPKGAAFFMNIEDLIDLELVGDFTGLSTLETKAYKARYDGIVKALKKIEALKQKENGATKMYAARRELIARVITDPTAYKSESSWAKAARIMENDQIHHINPLKAFSRITYGYRPRQIADLHAYAAAEGIYFGNHPRNAQSFHEVTHKGSIQAKPGDQGSPQASAHPRGTNEGDPYKFDVEQTPKQRTQQLLEYTAQHRKDVANVLVPGGLEATRRAAATDKLVELAATRNIDLQPLVADGVDILDPDNRHLLPRNMQDLTGWLRGKHRENVNFPSGQKFGVKMYGDAITPTMLAAYGLGAIGPVGTGFSAAETGERFKTFLDTFNPLDAIQAGVSSLSLAGDFASYFPPAAPIGEAVSSTADGLNIVMDKERENPGTIRKLVTNPVNEAKWGLKQLAKNPIVRDPGNELEYRAKQAKEVLNSAAGFFAQARSFMSGI